MHRAGRARGTRAGLRRSSSSTPPAVAGSPHPVGLAPGRAFRLPAT